MYSRRLPKEESPLVEAVRELRDEIRGMREVLAELVEAAEWQNNNAEDYPALIRDRSAPWTLADYRLPKLLEELNGGPPAPIPDQKDAPPRSQRDLF